MKKRTKVVIRLIGALLLILALVTGIMSFQDDIINGLELATVFCKLMGLYLLVASEKSLRKWRITTN